MEKPAKEYYELYLKIINYFSPTKLRLLLSFFIGGLAVLLKMSASIRRMTLRLGKFIAFITSIIMIIGTWGLLKLK